MASTLTTDKRPGKLRVVADVIAHYGGPARFCVRFGSVWSHSRVCNWQAFGSIPAAEALVVFLALRSEGVPIKPEVLGIPGDIDDIKIPAPTPPKAKRGKKAA